MPIYDRVCKDCATILIDCYEPVTPPTVLCECGGETERAWTGHANAVIADDIPGGIWIKNGLCNDDGSPRKYYSHTEINLEAKKRGLTNYVTHIPNAGKDTSDKTSRWF